MNKIINLENLELQELEYTEGWQILWNKLYNYSTPQIKEDILISNFFKDDSRLASIWLLYDDDLIYMVHDKRQIAFDLGWGPGNNPEGAFHIIMVRMDDQYWEHPLVEFSSRNKDEIVAKLNELMLAVSNGEIS
ncbi:MAG: hypothetical protein K0M45_05605 [Candidatus Paracaedibacteraceae bacterium]|nr:hypothetical protein [Candidatus Paracaedibacteraceae bacterium]